MSQGATTTSAQAAEVQALDVQLPVDLARAVESYVAQRPGLDPARLLQTALAQFLVQQGAARPEVRELYLDGLFGTGL
jgi:hypothetical protein